MKTHCEHNPDIDFDERIDCVIELDQNPTQLLKYQPTYSESFLFPKYEEIVDSMKQRYAKYEAHAKTLLQREGIEYSRIYKTDLSNESTIVVVGRVASYEAPTLNLECLGANNKTYKLECQISDEVAKEYLPQIFENQHLCLQGVYNAGKLFVSRSFTGIYKYNH